MIEDIIEIINNIGEYHEKFSFEFYSNRISWNLKKLTIEKILKENSYNGEFMDIIDEYVTRISVEVLFLKYSLENNDIELRWRGKNKDSIMNKLYYYRFGRKMSAVPVQKCLNDIFGFRLILDTEMSYDEIFDKILKSNSRKVELFRPYIREDELYRGIHIYLKSGNNKYLPWEIQMWRKCDEETNEREHKKHKSKREYINWLEIYEREK